MSYWKYYFIKFFQISTILVSTFCLAIILNSLPLPDSIKWLMPNWVALFLIYWLIFMPELIGVVFTFSLGIVVDLLLGNIVGSTSICLLPVVFFAERICHRFNAFSVIQQFLAIIALISLSQLIKMWLQMYINHSTHYVSYWASIFVSIMVWPLVCGLLHFFRKTIKFC
jgi:rod shape-determining protein MreD